MSPTDLRVSSGTDGGALLVVGGDVRCRGAQVRGGHQHAADLAPRLVVVEQQWPREGSNLIHMLVT